jgi:2-haloacid dehalogenase
MPPSTQRSRILVFDVNETLLDIEALAPFFARVFGDREVMRQWFAQQILYAQAVTFGQRYTPFGTLAVAVLQMVAKARDVHLQQQDIDEFSSTMKELSPHADASAALRDLADAGFRMVTLSNSPLQQSTSALSKAGLAQYFEVSFSVDSVRQFKPAPAVYAYVAAQLSVEPARLRMIAAHAWDLLGALSAGYAGALVTRPGNAPLMVGEQPDIIARTLGEVAERIVERDG